MAKISKIEAQKRQRRYNIYLDGHYAFPVAESVLVQFRLMWGMEVTQAQVAAITTADQQARAYSKVLDYLAHRLRTEHEVIEKMHDLGTPEQFVVPILQKLRAQHLVDDHEYAASYVRTAMVTSLKGPQRIRQYLRQKRVGENDIAAALAQFTPERQEANATKLAQKLFRRYRNQPQRRQEEKVRQGLMTKGYASTMFDQIKASIEPAADPQRQDKLLAHQAAKLWHHYRRYRGYQRVQHFKQGMYRRGFDLDRVQAWLDEHEENLP